MADILAQMLADRQTPSSATGSWDEPEPPPQVAPGPSFLERIRRGRIAEGQRLAGMSGAEQAHEMPGLGHFMDSYDASKEGRGWAAGGNALLGLLDLAGGASSKAPRAADAALRVWQAAVKARPDEVAALAAENLAKLRPPKFKAGTKADQARADTAGVRAERAIPEPATPGGVSAEEAGRRLGVTGRTWPGNTLAGILAAGATSGIPGVVLDDAMSHLNPMHRMWEEDKQEQRAPFQAGTEPEVAHYQQQIDRDRHERNVHAGFAAGSLPAGIGTTYGTIKSAPWALRSALPGLELAMMGGMVHPALAVPGLAMAAAPLALPVGLGAATWGLANVAPTQIEQAQKKHAAAKLIQRIQDQYRDQPGAPSLTPDQAY